MGIQIEKMKKVPFKKMAIIAGWIILVLCIAAFILFIAFFENSNVGRILAFLFALIIHLAVAAYGVMLIFKRKLDQGWLAKGDFAVGIATCIAGGLAIIADVIYISTTDEIGLVLTLITTILVELAILTGAIFASIEIAKLNKAKKSK